MLGVNGPLVLTHGHDVMVSATNSTPTTVLVGRDSEQSSCFGYQLDERDWRKFPKFPKSHATDRPGDSHSRHPTMLLLPITAPAIIRPTAVRAFASTARAAQAVPAEKPILTKEFKIYRWVCVSLLSVEILTTLNVES
jgi:hypothetical protein